MGPWGQVGDNCGDWRWKEPREVTRDMRWHPTIEMKDKGEGDRGGDEVTPRGHQNTGYLKPPPPGGTHGAIVPDDGEQGQPVGTCQGQVGVAVSWCHLHCPWRGGRGGDT